MILHHIFTKEEIKKESVRTDFWMQNLRLLPNFLQNDNKYFFFHTQDYQITNQMKEKVFPMRHCQYSVTTDCALWT